MDHAWATIEALAEDRSSGAAEIARRAAGALPHVAPERLKESIEILIRGHPSMAPLWRLGAVALSASHGNREAMHRFLRMLDRDADVSEVMAEAMPGTVVTISWSSSVIGAIRTRRPDRVACMISEPGGEGRRTADALRDSVARVEVWNDREAIERVPGEAVVVGADAVTTAGVVNKIRTHALALAAHEKGIPTYAVAGGTKLVADELPVREPFESTPLELFTAVAVPEGLLLPQDVRPLAQRHAIHPELAPLLKELCAAHQS
jgi:translation initiation factor 2B subunit (eIF-2B alpha/beta/delta family)